MQWLLGTEAGVEFLPVHWERDWQVYWVQKFQSPELLYGGYLRNDILESEEMVACYHDRLKQDFLCGWSAVGFTASFSVDGVMTPRKQKKTLGPFCPPTVARPHLLAPFGLYLLSAERLRSSLSLYAADTQDSATLARALHSEQQRLGSVFCDPTLELRLTDPLESDFAYKPPTVGSRLTGALMILLGLERLP